MHFKFSIFLLAAKIYNGCRLNKVFFLNVIKNVENQTSHVEKDEDKHEKSEIKIQATRQKIFHFIYTENFILVMSCFNDSLKKQSKL